MIEWRPTLLLLLASMLLAASASDDLTLLDIPFLRSVAGLLGVVLVISWVLFHRGDLKFRRGAEYFVLCLFVVVIALTCVQVLMEAEVRMANVLQWLQPLVLVLILIDLMRDPRAFKYIGVTFFFICLCIALAAVVGLNSIAANDRAGFGGLNLNAQSFYYGIVWLSLVAILLYKWPRVRKSWLIFLSLIVFFQSAQIATGSRGAILATFLGFFLLLTLFLRARNASAYLVMVPVVIGCLVLALFSMETFIYRMQDTLSGEDLGTRDVIWSAAWTLIKQRPITGQGPAFMDQLGPMVGASRYSTHNTFLQVFTAYGLVGFLAYFGFIGVCLKRCWDNRRCSLAALFFVLLITSLMFGMTGDLMFDRFFWALLAMSTKVAPLCRLGLTVDNFWRVRSRRAIQGGRGERVLLIPSQR